MKTKLRIPRWIARLAAAFIGTEHLRPPVSARNGLFAGVALWALVVGLVFHRSILHEPEPGAALAGALEYLPATAVPFRDALDMTWRRQMSMAGTLKHRGTEFVASRVPPALCPAGSGSLYAGPDSERLRQLVDALDAALRSGAGRNQTARQALADLNGVSLSGRDPLAAFYQDYNLARGSLLLGGDSAKARALLAPYFSRNPSNPLREGSLDRERSTLLFHARMVSALAALQLRDTLAISHFRGGVRMLKAVAPYSRAALGDGSKVSFAVDPGLARCEGTVDTDLSNSMDTWAGLVAAYRHHAGRYTDTQDLSGELADLGDDRTDPLYPLLRHGVQIAAGKRSPVGENFIWAASNLRSVYAANRLDPDPRLEVARTVLLVELVDNPTWMEAVNATEKIDRCALLGRLARELESGSRGGSRGETFADSMRAALVVHVYARWSSCDGALQPADDGLRSDWIRLGARALGDTVGPRVEEWRRGMLDPERDPDDVVPGTVRRSQILEDALRPSLQRRILRTNSDTTHRFLTRWRSALVSEVSDSLRARCAANLVDSGDPDHLPGVMLGLALHARERPSASFTAEDLRPVLGEGLPLVVYLRYLSGEHPLLATIVLGILAIAILVAGARWYLWTWRRRMLAYGRFYATERRGG
jgi:hypothetical protein